MKLARQQTMKSEHNIDSSLIGGQYRSRISKLVINSGAKMSAKQQALRCYKKLLRTRTNVFKDDDFALKKSHAEIRSAFEKNRGLRDPEQIQRSIELAEQVEEILRKEVMQARFITDDKVRVNVRLDNVRDAKAKTFSFVDDD